MNLDNEPADNLDNDATEQGHGEPSGEAGEHLEALDVSGAEVATDAGDDDPAFVFEGDDPEAERADDSSTIRDLRAKLREEQREKHELKKQVEAAAAPKADALPAKPTLEACGYDEEQFEQELTAWHGKKAEQDAKQSEQQAKARKMQESFQAQANSLGERGNAVVKDFDAQVAALADKFGTDLNGNAAKAALVFADDPRLIIALNNSPAKLAELLALKDMPLALAVKIGELKGKIQTMHRRTAPAPETVTKGGAPVNASADKQLEKLEKEAERTGNRTAVVAYKRSLRA